MKILLGVAGTSGLGYPKGLEKCKELSLDCLEVEFTYGVNMSNSNAKEIGEIILANKEGEKIVIAIK